MDANKPGKLKRKKEANPASPNPAEVQLNLDLDSGQPQVNLPQAPLSAQTLKSGGAGPVIISRLAPAQPTEIFDTYWRFAAERQNIFFRRVENSKPPWTSDPILTKYKFTNAYRASDRVSQYLINKVIYSGSQSAEEVFFRIILFKIFNKIETWELLCRQFGGQISYGDYSFERYDRILSQALTEHIAIFSAAYIMPSRGEGYIHPKKHRNYLEILTKMMRDELPLRVANCRNMRQAFELLRGYPMLGDFLAYQYVTDLNYSELTNFSEREFVIPGPGAKNGIQKCFRNYGGLTPADLIVLTTERQEEEFGRLGLTFRSLWGRPLQLIDCQNLFCEVDKYARVAHPNVKGISDRKRIKQTYKTKPQRLAYWFPPKWGLNQLIEASV